MSESGAPSRRRETALPRRGTVDEGTSGETSSGGPRSSEGTMADGEPEGAQLAALDQLRVRGVRSIGHRVRTPISIVVSSMQAVTQRDDVPDEARKHLDVAIDQMQRVTDDLEMLTDLGAWTAGMAQRSLRLGELVEDVAGNRLAATTWEGVDYEFVIDDSIEVAVDEPTVRWAIDATVRDAVRRLEDRGTVVITTADDPTLE